MKHMKKLLSLLLVLCLVLSLSCTAFAAGAEKPLDGKTVILHSNDVHGAIDLYAAMAALKADYEAQGAEVILADAGDYSQGTVYVSVNKGADAVTMMNATGYDVVTLGNHEFDYGYAQLAENMKAAKFQVLCADVLGADGKTIFDANTIIEKGGVKIGFSSLLVCMMLGTVFCNVCDFSAEIMEKTDRWTAPLYILFFVLSGAELELNVFSSVSVVIIGAAYILARSVGKWLGASISAKFMKCPPKVQKWLGITLLPQAGVALGMSVTVAQTLGADGVMVRNIVLFGVLIYELVGPALTRIALTEAGDIQPKAEAVVSADD